MKKILSRFALILLVMILAACHPTLLLHQRARGIVLPLML